MTLISLKEFRQRLAGTVIGEVSSPFEVGDWVYVHTRKLYGVILFSRAKPPKGIRARIWHKVRLLQVPLDEVYGSVMPFFAEWVPSANLEPINIPSSEKRDFELKFQQWQTWDNFGRPDRPKPGVTGRLLLFNQAPEYWGKPVREYPDIQKSLLKRASPTVVELTTPEQVLQSRALEGRVFGGKFPNFPHRRFGVYDGDQLVATIRANANPLRSWRNDDAYPLLAALKPNVWVSATAVDPEYRGKGYATALRARLQREYSSILTSTGRSSDPAIKVLNERQGFKPVLTRPSVTVFHWRR